MNQYPEKKKALLQKMKAYATRDVMVAFSGGVDSSLLLKLACDAAAESGKMVYAATVKTRLHPLAELEEAAEICAQMGARHILLTVDELKEAGITDNPVDRCYRCKRHLFRQMLAKAAELGVTTLLEGTNEDDLHVYRPGIRALEELAVISPLAQAALTKQEVRELAGEYGLSVATKPAAPCLATRFPYGTILTHEKMRQVEKGEAFLKGLGLRNVRLRVHGEIARIEVDRQAFPELMEHREEILSHLKDLGYHYITLDLEGFRSGSMDEGIELPESPDAPGDGFNGVSAEGRTQQEAVTHGIPEREI